MELDRLIIDLALILTVAGITTLVFKKLKQPLVLGYVVAGFLASPHMPYTPSVQEMGHVNSWAEIGVIFLLFGLGLEFSFKKIVKMGISPVVSSFLVVLSMMSLGYAAGYSFGWSQTDSLFLGGMLAMSSTTIIYKAFDDLGLRQQRFTGLVLSVLVLEDILAILLMVMLSTVAVSQKFEGMQMAMSFLKLLFCLVLWFVIGIFVVPSFLRRFKKIISDEMLLVFSLGMCFAMVVVAAYVGFSSAFGAFMMGSIFAETVEAERIERLLSPVKDLFGAIFFVSVGMLVDPHVLLSYWFPILAITIVILLGQGIFGSLSFLLSGQSLRVSMQCGFSMAQIGEFAFIIASLGLSLGVISDYLYPIVVAVSVITTFLTPYMIRAALPVYGRLEEKLPSKLKSLLNRNSSGLDSSSMSAKSEWRDYISIVLKKTFVYLILSLSVILLMCYVSRTYIFPMSDSSLLRYICCIFTILAASPFLRALVMTKVRTTQFRLLWDESRLNRLPLLSTVIVRVIIVGVILVYTITYFISLSMGIVVLLAITAIISMAVSRRIKRQSKQMEDRFLQNLRSRDIRAEHVGEQTPSFARRLESKDIHLSEITVPMTSLWSGRTLSDIEFGKRFGVHLSSIIRPNRRINIPKGTDVIFPGDVLQVIGSDECLDKFATAAQTECFKEETDIEDKEMVLRSVQIREESPVIGMTIRSGVMRRDYHCMVVGQEKDDGTLASVNIDRLIRPGDIYWIVGEKKYINLIVK